jgi:conjugative relaxase-like TrwC/TraI family protein
MLTISLPLKGIEAVDYYLRAERLGYYQRVGSEPGSWLGSGAEKLGLHGDVEPMDLLHLWAGYFPNGKGALVQNAGDDNRVSAWDLTFSDPKPVSVLWGVGSAEVREVVDRSRRSALIEAVSWLEDAAGLSRRGAGGRTLEPAKLTFAAFDHRTSRQLEPATHAHVLMLNVGVRADGSTGSLHTQGIFELKMEAGERYRNSLEKHLLAGLQIQTEKREVGFHIVQVPESLCDRFSTRRKEILAAMEARGVSGAIAAKVAALDTRQAKKDVSQTELFAAWKQVAEQHGWNAQEIRVKQSESKEKTQEAARQADQDRKSDHERQSSRTAEREAGLSKKNQGRASGESQKQESRQQENRRDRTRRGSSGRDESKSRREHEKSDQRSRDDGDGNRASRDPKRDPFFRVEMRHLAPNAPSWSPFRNWKLPVVVVGRKQRLWGRVRFQRKVGNVLFKVQQRRLFPNAPRWSPFHKVSIPAFRIQSRTEAMKRRRQWKRRNTGESYSSWSERRSRANRSERLRRERERASQQRSQSMNNGH